MERAPQIYCTVCRQPLDSPIEFDGRYFCNVHGFEFFADRPFVWRACFATLASLVAIIVLLTVTDFVFPFFAGLKADPTIVFGITVVPACVWVISLYVWGLRPPVPLARSMFLAAAFGALIAFAVARPLLNGTILIGSWIGEIAALDRFLMNTLLIGSLNVLFIYLFVRHGMWAASSFANRSDGVLFAFTASMGYGSIVAGLMPYDRGGFLVVAGSLRTLSVLCAHLSSGLVIGYVLGHNRFQQMPVIFVWLGVMTASVINGSMIFIASELSRSTLSLSSTAFNPFPAVALNLLAFAAILLGVSGLLRRQNSLIKARIEGIAPRDAGLSHRNHYTYPMPSNRRDVLSASLVVTAFVASIGMGWLVRQQAVTQTWIYESRTGGVLARYPAGWLVDEQGPYLVSVRDPNSRPFKTRISITVIPTNSKTSIRVILDRLTLQRSAALSGYRVLGLKDRVDHGVTQSQVSFAFVETDPNPYVTRLPIVVMGEDVIILDDDRAIVATYMADEQNYAKSRFAFERFVATLRF